MTRVVLKVQVWDERVDRKVAAAAGVTATTAPAGAAVPGRKAFSLTRLLGDLLIWAVLLVSILILALAVLARTGAQSGTQWLVVVSNSMWPELRTGDLVAVRSASAVELQVGDIITFEDARNRSVLVTHRIIAKDASGAKPVFQVKGDNNPVADPELVQASQVVGRVRFRLPLAGYLIHALQARPILAFVALMPSVVIFGLKATVRGLGVRSP